MRVYLCPCCNSNLHRSELPGRGFCIDCRSIYRLNECITMDRMVPRDERDECLEATA